MMHASPENSGVSLCWIHENTQGKVMRLTGLNFHKRPNKQIMLIALSRTTSADHRFFMILFSNPGKWWYSHYIQYTIIQIQKTCIDIHPRGGELHSLKACSVLGPLTHAQRPKKSNKTKALSPRNLSRLAWSGAEWAQTTNGGTEKKRQIFLVIPEKSLT